MHVRWKLGNYEIEVAGEEEFIEKHLSRFESKIGTLSEKSVMQSGGGNNRQAEAPVTLAGDLAPAEFLRKVAPNGGVATLITLGKYLHDFRKKSEFTRGDIRTLSAEVRIKDIHSQYYSLALQRGLLREVGSAFAVTMSGDDTVQQLLNSRTKAASSEN
jgi:hypothetical protein